MNRMTVGPTHHFPSQVGTDDLAGLFHMVQAQADGPVSKLPIITDSGRRLTVGSSVGSA